MAMTWPTADTWRDVDRKVFERVRAHRTESSTKAARAVSALAEPGMAYPVLGLAGIAGAAADWRRRVGVHWPGDMAAGWLFAAGWLRMTRQLPDVQGPLG